MAIKHRVILKNERTSRQVRKTLNRTIIEEGTRKLVNFLTRKVAIHKNKVRSIALAARRFQFVGCRIYSVET